MTLYNGFTLDDIDDKKLLKIIIYYILNQNIILVRLLELLISQLVNSNSSRDFFSTMAENHIERIHSWYFTISGRILFSSCPNSGMALPMVCLEMLCMIPSSSSATTSCTLLCPLSSLLLSIKSSMVAIS